MSDTVSSSYDDALFVVNRLRKAGHTAYFAGGCVRDKLLGQVPKDYDVATDAPPGRVRELFVNSQPVGAAFGVILVRQRRSCIEVATFRTDGEYEDGRRPTQVRFTTAQEDARRRDFTINGLFFDPIEQKVIDYVGGLEDIQRRRLRAIGEASERFAEDYLRMLRAVRFAARFGLEIDPATHEAIGRYADRLVRISPERIAEELRQMLRPSSRKMAWRLLWQLGLVGPIGRFIERCGGKDEKVDATAPLSMAMPLTATPVAAPPVMDPPPLFEAIAPGEDISFGLALAGLCLSYAMSGTSDGDYLEYLGTGAARRFVHAMRQALRISNDEAGELRQIVASLRGVLEERPVGLAQAKRFLAQPTSDAARQLLRALGAVGYKTAEIEELERQLAEVAKSEVQPTPLLSGDELTRAGWRPGPIFKKVLEQVYDAQLEGEIATADEAMELAQRLRQLVE